MRIQNKKTKKGNDVLLLWEHLPQMCSIVIARQECLQ